MALSYGFYNSYNGDRKYNCEQISSMFDGVINDGVFDGIGEIFATIPGDGLQVIVKTGKAWLNHTWLVNDAWYPLNLNPADTTRKRIDAVVIEVNHKQEVRKTSLKIIQGFPSSVPEKPSVEEADLVKQYPIAYVTVQGSATQISASDIEINVGRTSCPFVTGIIESVAIDDLFNAWSDQFQTFLNDKETDYQAFLTSAQNSMTEWMSQMQNDFSTWFNGIKDLLDPDAGEIVTIAANLNDLNQTVTKEIADRKSADTTLQNNINNKQDKITATGILKGNGNGSIGSATIGNDLVTPLTENWLIRIFRESQTYVAPAKILNPVHVICMGGGGGGGASIFSSGSLNGGGGGSGHFSESTFNITPNASYSIVIGKGGVAADTSVAQSTSADIRSGENGGTTKFGSLVSANGGNGGNGMNGGNGGAGGGAGSGGTGGNGSAFGGGGGSKGGNGGTWGGGGGGYNSENGVLVCGKGGTYGGNSGYYNGSIYVQPEDGKEFIPSFWYQLLFGNSGSCTSEAYKLSGATGSSSNYAGGGGYGGRSRASTNSAFSGGGGYGSGNSGWCNNYSTSSSTGGGGYGSSSDKLDTSTGHASGTGGAGIQFIGFHLEYVSSYSATTEQYVKYGYGGNGGGKSSSRTQTATDGTSGVCILFYRTSDGNP